MILAVGNVKGGVGKTTLAINLAIVWALQERDVLLIDGDEQATAMAFTELRTGVRGEPGYTAVALHGAAIRTQVRQLASKYHHIIIDVGGRDTGSLRARPYGCASCADSSAATQLRSVGRRPDYGTRCRGTRAQRVFTCRRRSERSRPPRPRQRSCGRLFYVTMTLLNLPRPSSSGARHFPTRRPRASPSWSITIPRPARNLSG